MHGFHGNPLYYSLEWDVPTKKHILASAQSRLLTKISLDIGLLLHGQIRIFSNLNIHEY